MRDYSSQREEIETIKPRTITVNLSDADVRRLAEKSGEGGLTISELLENFIGDLVDEHIPMEVTNGCMRNSGISVVGLPCFQMIRF